MGLQLGHGSTWQGRDRSTLQRKPLALIVCHLANQRFGQSPAPSHSALRGLVQLLTWWRGRVVPGHEVLGLAAPAVATLDEPVAVAELAVAAAGRSAPEAGDAGGNQHRAEHDPRPAGRNPQRRQPGHRPNHRGQWRVPPNSTAVSTSWPVADARPWGWVDRTHGRRRHGCRPSVVLRLSGRVDHGFGVASWRGSGVRLAVGAGPAPVDPVVRLQAAVRRMKCAPRGLSAAAGAFHGWRQLGRRRRIGTRAPRRIRAPATVSCTIADHGISVRTRQLCATASSSVLSPSTLARQNKE